MNHSLDSTVKKLSIRSEKGRLRTFNVVYHKDNKFPEDSLAKPWCVYQLVNNNGDYTPMSLEFEFTDAQNNKHLEIYLFGYIWIENGIAKTIEPLTHDKKYILGRIE